MKTFSNEDIEWVINTAMVGEPIIEIDREVLINILQELMSLRQEVHID